MDLCASIEWGVPYTLIQVSTTSSIIWSSPGYICSPYKASWEWIHRIWQVLILPHLSGTFLPKYVNVRKFL